MTPSRLTSQILSYRKKRKIKTPWLTTRTKDLQEMGITDWETRDISLMRRNLRIKGSRICPIRRHVPSRRKKQKSRILRGGAGINDNGKISNPTPSGEIEYRGPYLAYSNKYNNNVFKKWYNFIHLLHLFYFQSHVNKISLKFKLTFNRYKQALNRNN